MPSLSRYASHLSVLASVVVVVKFNVAAVLDVVIMDKEVHIDVDESLATSSIHFNFEYIRLYDYVNTSFLT